MQKTAVQRSSSTKVIKNYGLMWLREAIVTGKKGAPTSLNGYTKVGAFVDFKDQIGIYVLYDEHKSIVYVGQTGCDKGLLGRLQAHTKDNLWNRWKYFSWLGFRSVNQNQQLHARQTATSHVTGYNYKAALNEMEALLIELIEPSLNKKSGNWKKHADEYYQQEVVFSDGNIDNISTKIDSLTKDVKQIEKLLEKLK